MGCKEIGQFRRKLPITQCIRLQPFLLMLLLVALVGGLVPSRPASSASEETEACRLHTSAGDSDGRTFVRHLGKHCSDDARSAQVVQAKQIMDALAKGQGVDLSGVIVAGDLFFDELPAQSLQQLSRTLTVDDQRSLGASDTQEFRLIRGTFSIRDSEVRGRVAHRTEDNRLVISGPVIFSGTRFQEAVDLSRTVFLGVVDCSLASFAKETLFVQGRFKQPAMFTQASFGPHTRFHRSEFSDAANFYRARFNGLAELLEVSFLTGAVFTESTFLSGTGFSGSRFAGVSDFLEAEFRGDVYFLFTQFEQGTRFRGANFRSVADFSQAAFPNGQDLSQAVFAKQPVLPPPLQSSIAPNQPSSTWLAGYGVTLALLLVSMLLLALLFKLK